MFNDKVKKKKSVLLRSGLYHMKTKDAPQYLFKILSDPKFPYVKWIQSGRNSNRYGAYYFRTSRMVIESDYIAGSLNRIRRDPKVEESFPPDSPIPENIEVENAGDGSVWFFFDKENNIVISDNSAIPRVDFADIFSGLIGAYESRTSDDWMTRKEDYVFSVTFDRSDEDFEHFFRTVEKLTEISFDIITPDNPFEDDEAEDIGKKLRDSRTKSGKLENDKEGLNKDAGLVQGVMSLTAGGHLNTKLVGRKAHGRKETHICDGNNDASYPVGTIPSDVEAFIPEALDCLDTAKSLRESRSDGQQVPKKPY